MNAAGDDKERTNHNHEGHIIARRMEDSRNLMNGKNVIAAHHSGQGDAKLVIVPFPTVLRDQRTQGNGQQQNSERQHDRPVRFRGHNIQVRHHF